MMILHCWLDSVNTKGSFFKGYLHITTKYCLVMYVERQATHRCVGLLLIWLHNVARHFIVRVNKALWFEPMLL
jgi:hypothetical protein